VEERNGRAGRKRVSNGLLRGSRVYLSGPMDFVASRAVEAKEGWRTRIGQVLRDFGTIVFDPWNKPRVRGLHGYGEETTESARDREGWTFDDSAAGAQRRAKLTGHYWETLHIDLRMVDTADFIRLLPHQHLQRRHGSRNCPKPTRAQACPVRQPASRISDLRCSEKPSR
jgi:hypothetical protein